MRIWKEFAFEAAHRLPNLPAEHKCARLHGHSYRFRLHVEGPVDPTTGWVVDFGGLLKAAGDLILSLVDHRYLNEIDGLANPTAELLACWIWDRVRVTQLPLAAVEVFETCTTGVHYTGPQAAVDMARGKDWSPIQSDAFCDECGAVRGGDARCPECDAT